MADMIERRDHGWVTADGTLYPREKADDWKDAVRQGLCPFCGAGPFRVVAAHTNQMHGIDTRLLRDMTGFTYTESICDPVTSQRLSVIAVDRGTDHLTDVRRGPRRPARRSRAGQDAISTAVALSDRRAVAEAQRRPHPCPICDTIIPTSEPRTCGGECLREFKSRMAKRVHTGRMGGPDERAKKTAILLASNERRRKPHPCPVCGGVVPTAQPLTCSRECTNTWNSQLRRGRPFGEPLPGGLPA